MKIYYYSGATLPSKAAKSVHIMKMCEAWGAEGHDVTLFAKGQCGEVYDYYGVKDNFKIVCAPNIPMPLISGIIRLAHTILKTKRLGPPDLAYGRDPIALLAHPFKDIQIVYEAHQMPYLPSHKWAVQKLSQRPNTKKMVVISDILKQDLMRVYTQIEESDICVAHDGANKPPKDSEHKRIKGNQSVFKVGYAGSVQDGKGIQTILALAAKCPNMTFHVVGGSDKDIERLNRHASPNLFFYGHQPHKDVLAYLRSFDTLIAPYKEKATIGTGQDISRWISPLKLFEYMAAHRPIVCSELQVIREILRHEHNALLVSPENLEGWAEALNRLKNDPHLSQALSRNAYDGLVNEFTWEKRARDILDFCQTRHTQTAQNPVRSAAQ